MKKSLFPFLAISVIGVVFLVLAYVFNDIGFLKKTTTYGNFDVPSERSFVQRLLPGTEDYANKKVYRFGHGIHSEVLIILGSVFLLLLFLRVIRSRDVRLGSKRWATQWATFVVTRLGVLRAAGVCPIKRTTFGSFPFLNCQACEMATGACPIGTLQMSLLEHRFPFLVFGELLIVAIVLGRWVCGWLCPFGYISDIIGRLSVHKLIIPNRVLKVKFYILFGIILILPAVGFLELGSASSIFCYTICPSGVIYGLLPYYTTTALPGVKEVLGDMGTHIGPFLLISFHFLILILFVLFVILISGRFFCRAICPVGAFLGLFNRISLVQVVHDKNKCVECDRCSQNCPMGIDLRRDDFLTVSNCIRCGLCVKMCPANARRWRYKFKV